MRITDQLQSVSRRFIVLIVGLSVVSVVALAAVLYQTSAVRFGGAVTSEQLREVIQQDEAVVQYLEDEKEFEAHFVTIASLVKQDQQKALGRAVLYTAVPVIVGAAVVGFFVARHLLKPVQESYESQERFMQDAAHELRNPLAAMSLAIENADVPSADTDFLRTMRRQSKRLIRINEDLLYLERLGVRTGSAATNISDLLEDILEDLQPTIADKSLVLKSDIQSGVHINIAAKDFIKLSRNIIENAIKYTEQSKQVYVKLHQDKKTTLTVVDEGIGIPKEDLRHIGERFYRSKNVGDIDGTGLGIAIVKKVLKTYGGTLSIRSSAGTGTTATVVL